jgi:hypothetical protein
VAAGPNTILDQTSVGFVTATLSGSYEDELKVVMHPDGRFNAHFNITCQCTVVGQSGALYLVAGSWRTFTSATSFATPNVSPPIVPATCVPEFGGRRPRPGTRSARRPGSERQGYGVPDDLQEG